LQLFSPALKAAIAVQSYGYFKMFAFKFYCPKVERYLKESWCGAAQYGVLKKLVF
jgi:hypothetical protein